MKRQITIYESAQNGKITVLNDVEVNTLGELKQLLDTKGISYNDMEFIEGVTNTKLLGNDSKLPENIPFKNKVTNNLFINILRKESKIKSGVDYYEMSRSEIMNAARPYSEQIREHFGKNFTQVKTIELASFLSNLEQPLYTEKAVKEQECPCGMSCEELVEKLVDLIRALGLEKEVLSALETQEEPFFSQEDIDSFLSK